MYLRNGKKVNAPKWFTYSFPRSPLDGELYIDRGRYQELVDTVLSKDKETDSSERWLQVTFCVFDAPALNLQFEHRYKVRKG